MSKPTTHASPGPPAARSTEDMSPVEARRLLAAAPFGRLVYTYGALPEVIPVNIRLDDEALLVRVSFRSRAARAALNTVVALQVDEIDPVARTGWSITVIGRSTVANPARIPDDPWVRGEHDLVIAIPLERVTGRRLVAL
ncbi:pyridoxamine 5'-phosphate oxidase family protein [Spongisporangium articulatum]|uniref:Pyridoxamine 5'-phosphate oxidase family protein n=1 Tax=Spongisporangium articulatum TaxID=3362603 RepID=A0ABW8AM65_9ACTN